MSGGGGDGALAWSVLRCSRDYRKAWRRHAGSPGFEDGAPFPVRVPTGADRAAEAQWGLLAWEDPDGHAASAFFAGTRMLDGEGSASAPPLLPLLAQAGAAVEGLRLGDGALVLKVEKAGHAVQVRVTDSAPLLAGGGVRLRLDWGLCLPVEIVRLTDLWGVSGGPPPLRGPGAPGPGTAS